MVSSRCPTTATMASPTRSEDLATALPARGNVNFTPSSTTGGRAAVNASARSPRMLAASRQRPILQPGQVQWHSIPPAFNSSMSTSGRRARMRPAAAMYSWPWRLTRWAVVSPSATTQLSRTWMASGKIAAQPISPWDTRAYASRSAADAGCRSASAAPAANVRAARSNPGRPPRRQRRAPASFACSARRQVCSPRPASAQSW